MKSRKIKNAENFINSISHLDSGWYIVDGFSFYGPYSEKEIAKNKLGKKDSLDMKVSGIIIFRN